MIDRSRRRTTAMLLGTFVLAFTLGASSVAAVRDKSIYEIYAILPLTGPTAFIGINGKKDLDLIEKIVNTSGGIQGHPLHFTALDDQGNPQITVQLTSDLIAKNVPVILGSGGAGVCLAMMPLVAKNGPVQYCLSPGIHPKRGSYTFSASVGVLDDAIGTIRFYRLNGWTRIAIVTSTDAIGQEMDRSFATVLALPENKSMQVVASEHFNPNDISVAAQVARVKAANPQAIISWTTGSPFGTLLRAINDAGLDIPVSSSTGNMSFAQMAQYKSFLPKQLYFAGLRSISRLGTARGPVRDAQAVYFNAFKAIGVRPDVLNAIDWDPAVIVVAAVRHIGVSATADQIRDYIANLHGFAATSGVYDFSDPEQRGLTINALVIDKWDPVTGDFVAASGPGGFPRKP
jgi:branched-chain amino acid transport system substrate-binding protein